MLLLPYGNILNQKSTGQHIKSTHYSPEDNSFVLHKTPGHPMSLESMMMFGNQVSMNIYRTNDNHYVETPVFAGTDYHKTLISVTNQIGCKIKCSFCKGKESSFARDITIDEYIQQIDDVVNNIGNVPFVQPHPKKMIKVGLNRAGESLLNSNTSGAIEHIIDRYHPSFQVTTTLPSHPIAYQQLKNIEDRIKEYDQSFQFNISMHTSDEDHRNEMMAKKIPMMTFHDIADWGEQWVRKTNNLHSENNRKIDLSFILINGNEVNIPKLKKTFNPEYFAIRFAYYLPSTKSTALLFKPSKEKRMKKKVQEALNAGYTCVESIAGPVEQQWDTRPFSGDKMLRKNI